MEKNIIVEEKNAVKLSKEEKLLLALNECNNRKLFQKAKVLFKLDLYSKNEVSSFDENAYVEVNHHNGHKCERCWNYFDELVEIDGHYVCPRCHEVIKDVE